MENTTPTPPGDTPEPATPHGNAPISKAQTEELQLARDVADIASKIEYAAALATEGIDAAFVTGLLDKIKEADALAGGATGSTVDKETDTRSEASCKRKLLVLVGKIQSRAKQKYESRDDPGRKRYYIGERIADNRDQTMTAAKAILVALATDTLPGMKPEDVPALQKALDDYQKSKISQVGDQSKATTGRSLLDEKVHAVMSDRRRIQFAVDGLWSALVPGNAGIRVEFKLSPHHALH